VPQNRGHPLMPSRLLQKFVESEITKWAGPIKAAGMFMD
jgi:hypothetical protein